MSGKMRRSEDLDLLLSASDTLLRRVHLACDGYPKDSKCKMFVDTYHEVRHSLRKLRDSADHLYILGLKSSLSTDESKYVTRWASLQRFCNFQATKFPMKNSSTGKFDGCRQQAD